ncbi:DNA-binding XRE family transcriptional regulator [Herbinix hemicellulosilytica]|uniref:HTH cro/C1-type domain-containing protein n=1 Tax=Herbinix hemicellulosilytica TaxID=1564487 RepID=A0A0H5SHJ6_HERHM|nr:helix-turn-helix transcriptional regulator [Herbinix hemicellulosilytica]RBP58834.1 DNA-binding XRE family transcriptional regulator [Herbinix hemicellulosilytica]CRZ34959.1 hypothetical protein HHT355_1759 [Herbinix hemicellulosilytica]
MLGDKIKVLREGKNVSQKELAQAIGVSDVMISLYEQGKKSPSLPTIVKIADYFNVSTDYLLGTKAVNNDIPENIMAAARNLLELPEENRKLAIDMIKYMSQKGKEAKEK